MSVHVGNACLDGAFDSPVDQVRRATPYLSYRNFETMVGTGFSGALVLPHLSSAFRKNQLLIRKPGDSHHHGSEVAEGDFGGPWIFVDDGISTGTTYRRVRKVMHDLAVKHNVRDSQFAGAYLYGHGTYYPAVFWEPGCSELREVEDESLWWNQRPARTYQAA